MKSFLLMIIIFGCHALTHDDGFRGFSWESYKNDELDSEKEMLLRDEGEKVYYNTSIGDDNFSLIYDFTNEKLTGGGYFYIEELQKRS